MMLNRTNCFFDPNFRNEWRDMRILVVGSGGREFSIARRLNVDCEVFVAPGNPAMSKFAHIIKIEASNIVALREFAVDNKIDLTFVGPEAPLVLGIVDEFEKYGLAIIGPNRELAMLTEGSKCDCQQFCQDAGVQIAPGACFDDPSEAMAYVNSEPDMLVVKADGLAGGKGVVVAKNQRGARDAVRRIMVAKEFGNAGNRIVIQKRLIGEEVSLMVVVDEYGYKILPGIQDYKMTPSGLNGGGNGAKFKNVSAALMQKFEEKILKPTLAGFKKKGLVYKGILFAGCMIVGDEIFLLEYNCRFGDPETQLILAKLKGNLSDVFRAITKGSVSHLNLEFTDGTAVLVVGCTPGYPSSIPAEASGKPIQGLHYLERRPDLEGDLIYAGVDLVDGVLVNKGGRALDFIGHGETDEEAGPKAYDLASHVNFEGMWVLPGIGTTI